MSGSRADAPRAPDDRQGTVSGDEPASLAAASSEVPAPLFPKIGVYSSLAASLIMGAAYSKVIVVMPSLRADFSIFALARRRWKPAGTARIASLASRVHCMGTSS